MQGFAGKVAVVTGAGSGIGQALAIELGRSGAHLAISDIDTEGLATTEERLKAIGAQVKSDRLNVTEREAFLQLMRQAGLQSPRMQLLTGGIAALYRGEVAG